MMRSLPSARGQNKTRGYEKSFFSLGISEHGLVICSLLKRAPIKQISLFPCF